MSERGFGRRSKALGAYAAIDRIDWPGGFYRRNTGWRAFARVPV
ncbi:MAG TPA: hypothetical protein VHT02_09730 [Methylocella sp.]|nr:hypothetical protein [Methylocella sp.]